MSVNGEMTRQMAAAVEEARLARELAPLRWSGWVLGARAGGYSSLPATPAMAAKLAAHLRGVVDELTVYDGQTGIQLWPDEERT